MEPSNLSSAQQQLMEYRLRKKREAETTPAPITPTESVEVAIPEDAKEQAQEVYRENPINSSGEIRRESSTHDEEKLIWKEKQDAYKRLLIEGGVQPLKLKVFDFTQGSENLKRLEFRNYDFLPTNTIVEPKYKKEDIKNLYSTIGIVKQEPVENIRRESQAPLQPLREEEKADDLAGAEANRPAGPQMPLLINLEGEEIVRRDFLCFRNVNRDVIGLLAIFALLAGVVSLLFLLSRF